MILTRKCLFITFITLSSHNKKRKKTEIESDNDDDEVDANLIWIRHFRYSMLIYLLTRQITKINVHYTPSHCSKLKSKRVFSLEETSSITGTHLQNF